VLRAARARDYERAIRAYVRVVVGADVFDHLPAAGRAVISANAHTIEPMLATFFAPSSFDREAAGDLRTPALLVAGELSPKLYRYIVSELATYLPDARLEVLEGASHGLHMEKPDEFAAIAREFLEAH
jgi:pimeloyl-ACP methyl ester carboxylesterase